MTPPPPELVERFQRDWFAATGHACAQGALIALSGGPDSTALLLLFAAARTLPKPIAATVDHRLRAASASEAGRAADLARACGVAHAILDGEFPDRVDRSANLSARARALRYTLLEEHAEAERVRWIVTAHHADDQLETMIMRLNRGSGVRGLSAVRRRTGERVVRPLLGWRRQELAAVVDACGIQAINDPSNVDDRFDRARLRKQLAGVDWLDARAVARSSQALAEADEAVEWAVDGAEREHVRYGTDQAMITPNFLPPEIRRRLVERCLRRVDAAAAPRGEAVTRAMAGLAEGRPTTLAGVLCRPVSLAGHSPLDFAWVFGRAPPRRGA